MMRDAGSDPSQRRDRSAKRAIEAIIGVPPRMDVALVHLAAGATQRQAAAAAGISQSRLSKLLHTAKGAERFDFWLRQEIRALAPKAIRALDRNLDSGNAIASVRSADSILDRVGLGNDAAASVGSLIVTLNLGHRPPQTEKIEHEP